MEEHLGTGVGATQPLGRHGARSGVPRAHLGWKLTAHVSISIGPSTGQVQGGFSRCWGSRGSVFTNTMLTMFRVLCVFTALPGRPQHGPPRGEGAPACPRGLRAWTQAWALVRV